MTMKRLFLILSLVAAFTVSARWQPDILGPGFEMQYVTQPDDYSGPVRSTVVRHRSGCAGDRAVLYVHGYNDYFFQADEARRLADSCWHFYAVDLRKYGRSILPGQRKFEARDMREYFADIDSALAVMHRDGINRVVLMGHSTGGLITSLYMNECPDTTICALVLNSPFLQWNMNALMRNIVIPLVGCIGSHHPTMQLSQGDSQAYAESLLSEYHGQWSYNTDWKTVRPEKVTAGWVNAISDAQRWLDRHSAIRVPVLLMHSSGSLDASRWTPECQSNDIVLNVRHIAERGRRLGPLVTERTVEGGMHDLFLSPVTARESAYQALFDFLRHL